MLISQKILKLTIFSILAFSSISCNGLDKLLYMPHTTPAQWCANRPCVDLGGFIFNEPLGSVLVFALAILWIFSGLFFLKNQKAQKSRGWFGISLVLGGIGAALAGISYQAFSYQLKCAGRDFCKLTNGFEVGYSVTRAVSASAMLAAVAFALTKGKFRKLVLSYCIVNTVVYMGVTLAGLITLNKVYLSFEVLMLFALPSVLFVLVISGPKYFRSKSKLDGSLFWAAIFFILVQVAYFGYYAAGITQALWKSGAGFYFSENDVLHVGMIFWLWYIIVAVGRELKDRDLNLP